MEEEITQFVFNFTCFGNSSSTKSQSLAFSDGIPRPRCHTAMPIHPRAKRYQGSASVQLQPPEGKKINIVVSHHKFGVNVSDSFLKGRVEIKEESLIIHKVEMRDEGSYTCSITAFPSGSLKGTTQLHVQGERIKISITPSQKPNLNTIFCFIFSNPTVPISGYIFYLSTNYQ